MMLPCSLTAMLLMLICFEAGCILQTSAVCSLSSKPSEKQGKKNWHFSLCGSRYKPPPTVRRATIGSPDVFVSDLVSWCPRKSYEVANKLVLNLFGNGITTPVRNQSASCYEWHDPECWSRAFSWASKNHQLRKVHTNALFPCRC